MSTDAIPSGGGFQDGIHFLLSGKLAQSGREAAEWVNRAINAIKAAPDNPHGDDDELIAEELLKRIEQRQNVI